jgi:3-hydroxyisobutyrate dehydrogenase
MTGKPRIGFIGIGNMGRPMAANVAKAGYALSVLDIDVNRALSFAQGTGARAADGAADLARGSDLVVTMLPTGREVRHALLEADGGAVAKGLTRGAVVIDMSSADPVATKALGAELAQRGIALVDAPVSGGMPRAETGTLAIMVGGDDDAAIARVWPVLQTMGKQIFRTGPLGSGHAMKALNNYVAAAAFTASAEALVLGTKFGLDPAVMVDVLNASSGRNFNTEFPIKQHVLTQSFAAGFTLALMAKDVGIAGSMADAVGARAPMTDLVRRLWAEARDTMPPGADFTAYYQAVAKLNG